MNSLFADQSGEARVEDLVLWIQNRVDSSKLSFFKRNVPTGGTDLCYWQGNEDIISDPHATSPKILWIYMDPEPGTTKAYKLWDLPDGTQAEQEVKVSCDADIIELLAWIAP